MHTKQLSLNNSCQRQEIKRIIEIVPHIIIPVLFANLIVKTIHVCDVTRLMIPPQQYQQIRMLQLVKKQQQDALHRVVPTIYIVSQHDIALFRNCPASFEHLQHVPELSMNITADYHRRLHRLNIRLLK